MPAQILPLVDDTLDYVRRQKLALAQQRAQQANDYRSQQLDLQEQRIQQQVANNPIQQQLLQAQLEQHHAATRESMFALNHAEALAPLQEAEAQQRLDQGDTQNQLGQQQLEYNAQEQPLRMDAQRQQIAASQQQMAKTRQEMDYAPGIYDRQNALADSQIQEHNAQMQNALDKQLSVFDQLSQPKRAVALQPFLKRGILTQDQYDEHMAIPNNAQGDRDSIASTIGDEGATNFDSLRKRMDEPNSPEDNRILEARSINNDLGKIPTTKEQAANEMHKLFMKRDERQNLLDQTNDGLAKPLGPRDLDSIDEIYDKNKVTLPQGNGQPLDPKLVGPFLRVARNDPRIAKALAIKSNWTVK